VTASTEGEVVDSRRITLIELGVPAAPTEHERRGPDAAAALVTKVRASAVRARSAELDERIGSRRDDGDRRAGANRPPRPGSDRSGGAGGERGPPHADCRPAPLMIEIDAPIPNPAGVRKVAALPRLLDGIS
jgi:hypothetical protein